MTEVLIFQLFTHFFIQKGYAIQGLVKIGE